MFTAVKKAFGLLLIVLTLIYTNGMIMQMHYCSMDHNVLMKNCNDHEKKCCNEDSDVSCCSTKMIALKITDQFETKHLSAISKILLPITILFKHSSFDNIYKSVSWTISFKDYAPPESLTNVPLRVLLATFLC